MGTGCTVGTASGTSSSNGGAFRPATVVFTTEPWRREGGEVIGGDVSLEIRLLIERATITILIM